MKADAHREQKALKWATRHFKGLRAALEREEYRPAPGAGLLYVHDQLRRSYGEDTDGFERRLSGHLSVNDNIQDKCGLAAVLIERGDSLPTPLRKFLVEFLRNPQTATPTKKPGPRASDKVRRRDDMINLAIERIMDIWGFAPTRNEASQTASAASIVKLALERQRKLILPKQLSIKSGTAVIARCSCVMGE